MEGKGKIIFKNGEEYEGIWKENEIIESNEMRKSNDDYEYLGGFLNGKFNGKGKIIYKNGNIYEGLWKDSKKEGKGKLKYFNDDEFIGIFKDDKEYIGDGYIL